MSNYKMRSKRIQDCMIGDKYDPNKSHLLGKYATEHGGRYAIHADLIDIPCCVTLTEFTQRFQDVAMSLAYMINSAPIKPTSVIIFGSVARGRAIRYHSDIDFVVKWPDRDAQRRLVPSGILLGCDDLAAYDYSGKYGWCEVDEFNWHDIEGNEGARPLIDKINKEGVVVYARG